MRIKEAPSSALIVCASVSIVILMIEEKFVTLWLETLTHRIQRHLLLLNQILDSYAYRWLYRQLFKKSSTINTFDPLANVRFDNSFSQREKKNLKRKVNTTVEPSVIWITAYDDEWYV